MIDVVFFGVKTGAGAGHHFHAPTGAAWDFSIESGCPLPRKLMRDPSPDTRWCFAQPRTLEQMRHGVPRNADDTQGRGFVHYACGWTIISWWDRSEDRRGGCNAVFFVRGYHLWTEALRRAREAFPREMKRMEAAYSIGLAGADLPDPGDDPAAAVEVVVCREVERLRALPPDIQTEVRRRMGWAAAPHLQPATNA